MKLYKFRITEILKGEVDVYADSFEEAENEARQMHLQGAVELDMEDEDEDLIVEMIDETEII